MYKHKIELTTYKDVLEFSKIASNSTGSVKLIDGSGFCVNGKSVLGSLATMEWDNLYCESEEDIFINISKFCVN